MVSRWMERACRGNRAAAVIATALLACFLVLNAFFLEQRTNNPQSANLPASTHHTQSQRQQKSHLRVTSHELEEYCSPAFSSSAIREGAGMDGALRLTNVLLLVRHGDRTPIHTVNNSRFINQKDFYAPAAFSYKKHLAKFRLVPSSDTEVEPPLHEALDPRAVLTMSDHELPPGTLTSWGFAQHVELGQALGKAYKSFVMGWNLHKDIYIRSTHYARTIQSAAGLMIGLLGSDLTSLKDHIPIHAYFWDAMEFMHGSGLRDSSKVEGEKAEQMHVVMGACERAVAFSKAQHAVIQPRKEVMKQLEGLFGPEVHSMKITELTDAIMPAYCHGEPLPCSQKGCVNIELLKEMKRDSDRVYCERYWGSQGGLNATKLSHFQLMNEIATRIQESATGKSHIKFSLLSGHDTVIAPVLASLGVSTCGWPPYASRLTFETWTTASEGVHTTLDSTYVRVLFNGKVVTTSIPGCVAASTKDSDISSMRAKSQLCPLPTLIEHISTLLKPYADLHTACQNS